MAYQNDETINYEIFSDCTPLSAEFSLPFFMEVVAADHNAATDEAIEVADNAAAADEATEVAVIAAAADEATEAAVIVAAADEATEAVDNAAADEAINFEIFSDCTPLSAEFSLPFYMEVEAADNGAADEVIEVDDNAAADEAIEAAADEATEAADNAAAADEATEAVVIAAAADEATETADNAAADEAINFEIFGIPVSDEFSFLDSMEIEAADNAAAADEAIDYEVLSDSEADALLQQFKRDVLFDPNEVYDVMPSLENPNSPPSDSTAAAEVEVEAVLQELEQDRFNPNETVDAISVENPNMHRPQNQVDEVPHYEVELPVEPEPHQLAVVDDQNIHKMVVDPAFMNWAYDNASLAEDWSMMMVLREIKDEAERAQHHHHHDTFVPHQIPIWVTPNGKRLQEGQPGGRKRRRDQNAPPAWLPSGWRMETRVRRRGRSAGHIDKYYISPKGRRGRSFNDVVGIFWDEYYQSMRLVSETLSRTG